MRTGLKTRLTKLETRRAPPGRTFVVFGATPRDHEREIEALQRSGAAGSGDRFMRLALGPDETMREPWGPFDLAALLQRIATHGRTLHGMGGADGQRA